MLKESIEYLITDKQRIYVDGTLGLGGHSEKILEMLEGKGKLIGIDQDEENLNFAKDRLKKFGKKFIPVHDNFSNLKALLQKIKIKKVNGVLLDLGISSPHVDTADRGFSFLREGPLDMRFDTSKNFTAADLLNRYSQKEIFEILKNYGEEPKAWKIATKIFETRRKKSFKSTNDLLEAIVAVYGKEKILGKSVATKTFQALRIAVNDELEVLKQVLDGLPNLISEKGRLVCISYHSLEDRIVKHKLRDMSKDVYEKFPPFQILKEAAFKVLTPHPILPSEAEIQRNPRSRSAKMRAGEKL